MAFYVDEYNAAGTWISGQYRKRENSRWVEALNFTYTPSSTNVATASLQVIVAGTGITAYLDNVQMMALGAETPPPPASNLVANGTFDAGISRRLDHRLGCHHRGRRREPRESGQPGELGQAGGHRRRTSTCSPRRSL